MKSPPRLKQSTHPWSRARIVARQQIRKILEGWTTIVDQLVDRPTSLVDVGCGNGLSATLFKSVSGGKISNTYTVGLDIFLPYLRSLVSSKPRTFDDVVLGDIRRLPLRAGCADVVICTEVIEHLTRNEGEELLEALERLARRQVILTTPNFNLEQGAFDGNPHQTHKSWWNDAFFHRRGYKVCGAKALKKWPRPETLVGSALAYLPGITVGVVWSPIIRAKPSIAAGIVCIKNVG